MDMGLGFLGTYITAAELVGKEPTLTIGRVTLEKVESLKATDDAGAGKMKDRVIVYFKESKSERGWLLNRTNAECIKELWGRETDNWLGHKVTLYTTPVRVGPKVEPGIRVKGSPELDKPRTFDLKLPRKKPTPMTLVPTGKTKPADAPPAARTAADYIAAIESATSAETAGLELDAARDLPAEEAAKVVAAYRARWE
jgi:hypothetical protein